MSAARELAATCLARDNLQDAEKYAREAHSHAMSNPFLLDILISVLIKKYGKVASHKYEIDSLFDALEKVGEEAGRSFFTTRKAEYEHLCGDNRIALDLIERAIVKTPKIFDAQRLRAEILLKDNQVGKAADAISRMREIVDSRDPTERRSNYRSFLVTEARYLTEVGKYSEAKAIYENPSVFSTEERAGGIRDIEIVQAFKSAK